MALGPKEMSEAIVRNLKAKTGKDVNEWITVVQQSGHTEKKAIILFLKNECKLGHFQAQKVFERFSAIGTHQ